jgi:dihydrofolate synthase
MINLGLARISKLLARTSIPWKAVHIAGTNGKGSVASIVSSLLHVSGISVGRFNSPHLIDRWDCITVNQQTVSKSVFLAVEKFVKDRNEAENIDASEFEILTATAFEIFTNAKVDIGVVECGLGGRLDATNVLKPEQVLCSVITKVGKDHEALLGNTVVKIAVEKAGILKNGRPFVIDQSNSLEVLMTVDKAAKKAGAVQVLTELPGVLQQQLCLNSGDVLKSEQSGSAVDISQWPVHQQQNIRTALLACRAIQEEYFDQEKPINVYKEDGNLGPEQIAAIVASPTAWPGRLQLIDTGKVTGDKNPVLLDGAHNQQAAQALDNYINSTYRTDGPLVWVIAMSKGKSTKDFAKTLFKHGDRVVVTMFGAVDGMPWVQSEDTDVLVQAIPDMISNPIYVEPEPWDALRKASELAGSQTQVVICGSLYLVGDVLRLLRDDPPEALDGLKWKAWTEEQRRKLELRKQGVFD